MRSGVSTRRTTIKSFSRSSTSFRSELRSLGTTARRCTSTGRCTSDRSRDNIQAFRLTNGLLSTTANHRTVDIFKYPGASLAISANGTSNGILWAIQRNGDCGVQVTCGSAAPGVLKAYDANNLGAMLYSSDQVPARDTFDFATKFSVPLVANGKVFVASMTKLTIYGFLP